LLLEKQQEELLNQEQKFNKAFNMGNNDFFKQHAFKESVEYTFDIPKIYISKDALKDMYVIVQSCSEEVGWLGTVDRVEGGFHIKEIFVPDQEVHSTTCEISPDGVSEVAMRLLKRKNGDKMVNSLRFWGHSHVNMGVFASQQDEDQFEEFYDNCDFFIRGVFNKKGETYFTIYLREEKVIIDDAAWMVLDGELFDAGRVKRIQSRIKDRVKHKSYVHTQNRIVTVKDNGHTSYYRRFNEKGEEIDTGSNIISLNDKNDKEVSLTKVDNEIGFNKDKPDVRLSDEELLENYNKLKTQSNYLEEEYGKYWEDNFDWDRLY